MEGCSAIYPRQPQQPAYTYYSRYSYPAVKDISICKRARAARGGRRAWIQNTNIGKCATIRPSDQTLLCPPGKIIPGPAGRRRSRGGEVSSTNNREIDRNPLPPPYFIRSSPLLEQELFSFSLLLLQRQFHSISRQQFFVLFAHPPSTRQKIKFGNVEQLDTVQSRFLGT